MLPRTFNFWAEADFRLSTRTSGVLGCFRIEVFLFCLDPLIGRARTKSAEPCPISIGPRRSFFSADWICGGKQARRHSSGSGAAAEFALKVHWQDEKRREQIVLWVVMYGTGGQLATLPRARKRSLAELIEISTSARPLHEVVM